MNFYNYDSIQTKDFIIKLDHIIKGNSIFNFWEENPYDQWKSIYKKNQFYDNNGDIISHVDWIKPEWNSHNVSEPNENYNPLENSKHIFKKDEKIDNEIINFYMQIKNNQYIKTEK